jgi:hypothetical protein
MLPEQNINPIVYNPDLILRIQSLYKQIYDYLEDKTYEFY